MAHCCYYRVTSEAPEGIVWKGQRLRRAGAFGPQDTQAHVISKQSVHCKKLITADYLIFCLSRFRRQDENQCHARLNRGRVGTWRTGSLEGVSVKVKR